MPVQQVLTHDVVIEKEKKFRLRKLAGAFADWRNHNDDRKALAAEMFPFVPEPVTLYDRYTIALSASPADKRSAIAVQDYVDLIAGDEKSQDERMLWLRRVIETWESPCRQHAIPSAPTVSKAPGGAGGVGTAASGGGAVFQALPAPGLSAPRFPRRAAAAAVTSGPKPVAGGDGVTYLASNTSKHCGFLGHHIDNFPTAVYVAGGRLHERNKSAGHVVREVAALGNDPAAEHRPSCCRKVDALEGVSPANIVSTCRLRCVRLIFLSWCTAQK